MSAGRGVGLGLAGFGGIGKMHLHGYRSLATLYPSFAPVRLAAVCTQSEASARAAQTEGGFERAYTRLADLVSDPSVDVIDCVLPNAAHREAVVAALAADKWVYCEKPLALSGDEARAVAGAAATSRGRVGLVFNYRFVPALQKAKQLIDAGALGEVYSFQAEYLHTGYQDATRPLSWRMRHAESGGGAIMDLGAHVIDLVRFLAGEIAAVQATTKTYITRRPVTKGSTELGTVDVDDAAWLVARLAGGGVGTIHVSRFATGSTDDLNLRIEGTKGALRFSLMDGNWLYWFDAGRKGTDAGWIRLETIGTFAGASLPPARAILGWDRLHAENQYQFLKAYTEGREPSPGLADGLAANLVMDAAYQSAREGTWVTVR